MRAPRGPQDEHRARSARGGVLWCAQRRAPGAALPAARGSGRGHILIQQHHDIRRGPHGPRPLEISSPVQAPRPSRVGEGVKESNYIIRREKSKLCSGADGKDPSFPSPSVADDGNYVRQRDLSGHCAACSRATPPPTPAMMPNRHYRRFRAVADSPSPATCPANLGGGVRGSLGSSNDRGACAMKGEPGGAARRRLDTAPKKGREGQRRKTSHHAAGAAREGRTGAT
jgi:hypothetical protein